MNRINLIFILITDVENNISPIDLNIEKRLHEENITIYIIDYKSSIKDVLEAYYE
jgi:hypothetical protein